MSRPRATFDGEQTKGSTSVTEREIAPEDAPEPADNATPHRTGGNEHAIAGEMSDAERASIGRRGYDEGEDESATEDEDH